MNELVHGTNEDLNDEAGITDQQRSLSDIVWICVQPFLVIGSIIRIKRLQNTPSHDTNKPTGIKHSGLTYAQAEG